MYILARKLRDFIKGTGKSWRFIFKYRKIQSFITVKWWRFTAVKWKTYGISRKTLIFKYRTDGTFVH
jgi:hypothetical protein